ncbi:MAG TPA: hypothetical protein VHW69_10730 [Rhizomicrobium sp.]|jgi:hypothetical protein|nr:hypothetical protein [Rhizomicrobium sp.]
MSNIPHHYPLACRNAGLMASIGLLIRSMPYALMRFAVLLSFSVVSIIWIAMTVGGAFWAGAHIAGAFGFIWFVSCAAMAGWFWSAILRYMLHLIECGHVAVLTELIVRGRIGNGSESMFAYGKRIVTEKFGQVNALFALNLLVRGIVNTIHNTLEGIGNALSIPGVESIVGVITAILRAATRYMDKVIFSYNLASEARNPWLGAQDGVVYYAQNAKPLLKQSVWIVVLEYALTAILWLALLMPAAALTTILPSSVREMGGVVTIVIAILFALAARGAFLKPVFLIMVMTRFHALIEQQPINCEWVARLNQVSDKFRELGQKAVNWDTSAAPTQPAQPSLPQAGSSPA